MVSHQSDSTIRPENSSCFVSFPGNFKMDFPSASTVFLILFICLFDLSFLDPERMTILYSKMLFWKHPVNYMQFSQDHTLFLHVGTTVWYQEHQRCKRPVVLISSRASMMGMATMTNGINVIMGPFIRIKFDWPMDHKQSWWTWWSLTIMSIMIAHGP